MYKKHLYTFAPDLKKTLSDDSKKINKRYFKILSKMKKILMTMVAALAAVSMNAQVYLGGGIGFRGKSYDGETTTIFSIKPEVGFTLNESSAIGLGIGFGMTGKNNTKMTVFGVNPYYRFNFLRTDKVNLFIDGSFNFEYQKGDGKANKEYKETAWSLGVRPGVAFNVNDKISFVSTVGFLGYSAAKPKDGKTTSVYGLNLDASTLNFGLFYNF